MAKWCNEGENDLVTKYIAERPILYLGLYLDVDEPAEDATLAILTEVSGSGYERQQLDGTNWSIVADLATHSQVIFEADATWGQVYGYFFTTAADGTSGLLLGVENFSDGPYHVQYAEEKIKIIPKLRAS